jgi:predicted RNase H-like HicB family nuclease
VEVTVRVQKDATGYWSEIQELPGCFASAGTLDELHEALGEAIGLYLHDQPIDLGDQALRVGEFTVTVPDEL